ncbi:MAG: divalent-cation tolerance protein CutA [Desulfobulbaceae bacterium]
MEKGGMSEYIQVVTTTDRKEDAERIAAEAVEKRLAACVQISSCRSVFRWQGAIEQADEFLCVMKSRRDLFPELEKLVRSLHTYEVPEIIAVEIIAGSRDYLAWLEEELRSR